MGRRIILASASPRRKELLEKITPDFEVIVAACDESVDSSMLPDQLVKCLSERKAEAVAGELTNTADTLIIASDTVVSMDDIILGKPKDKLSAFECLRKLSGRSHLVYSGVCIMAFDSAGVMTKNIFCEKTVVNFAELSDKEILDYIETGEPMDKAGSYGIQGIAGKFISSIEGDYYNVVGLPLAGVYRQIKDLI